jgi:hypothetical protein
MLDQASNIDSAQQDMEGSVTYKPLSIAQGGQECSVILLDQPSPEDHIMNLETKASQSMIVQTVHVGQPLDFSLLENPMPASFDEDTMASPSLLLIQKLCPVMQINFHSLAQTDGSSVITHLNFHIPSTGECHTPVSRR